VNLEVAILLFRIAIVLGALLFYHQMVHSEAS